MALFMKVRFCLKMKTRIIDTIVKYNMLSTKDTVVVGVSGGADSVCLLFLLCSIAGEFEINIEVVHVNHNLRTTAERDEKFVEALCIDFEKRFEMKIPFYPVSFDIKELARKEGISLEEAGRMARYQAMRDRLGNKKGCIAVAHHANDRAETMLFNLFRGSGIRGLGGIRPVSDGIIRPLLGITRKEIEEFLLKEGLSFVTDETNLSDDYSRNKIRHNIIEYAENKICSGAVTNMSKAAEQLVQAEDFLQKYTEESLSRCMILQGVDEISLSTEKLFLEDKYIRSRILHKAICDVAGKSKDIGLEHVNAVESILGSEGSKKVDLPYGTEASREYEVLKIRIKKTDIQDLKTEEPRISMNILEKFNISDIPRDAYTKWFDYDKISTVAKIRFRQEGDYLCINSSMQKKSLKEYLINEKIPMELRDRIILLADGNHVMWVMGMRISEYYKVTSQTKRVLEVRYDREN